MQSNVGVRLRVRYTKLGKVRFVSHRDGARLWERALRRVNVPVAYTEGFTPRPKIGFGLALPTAAESIAEYVDLDLSRDAAVDPTAPDWNAWLAGLTDGLSGALPVGVDALAIAERAPGDGSLQERVTSTTWELTGLGLEPDELDTALQRVLAADELLVERERKGQRRTDDVRPLIRDLRVAERTTIDGVDHIVGAAVVADLVTIGRALRPSELAGLIRPGIDGLSVRVLRTHQWIDHDGERREVIPLERPITRTNDHDRSEPDVRADVTEADAEERRRTARAHAGGQAQ